jgi:hemerythrin-like domain-containing protein
MNAPDSADSARLVAWGQEMRAVHRRLVDALDIARESIEDGSIRPSLTGDLQLYCLGFCSALTGHHTAEDNRLFPRVLRDRPELAPAIATLIRDHTMIAHLIRDLEHALANSADTPELLRHLDGIEAVMVTHFRFEEKQLVGLLDAMAIEADRTVLFGAIA